MRDVLLEVVLFGKNLALSGVVLYGAWLCAVCRAGYFAPHWWLEHYVAVVLAACVVGCVIDGGLIFLRRAG
jgi:hypothetical protein